MSRSTRRWVLALLAGASLSAAAAQEAVFRAALDLVTVDAVVLGRDGRPVEGLGSDDFLLEVDGQPRRVVSAQFVSQAAPASRPSEAADLHFTSNERADAGRLIMIAIDEAHIRRLEGRAALGAAAAFIGTLDPLDNVAVTGLTRIGVIEFTRDRGALKRRLETLVGHADPVFLQFNIGLVEAVEVADGNRARLAEVVLRECGRSLTEYTSAARAADDAGGRDACPEQVEQEARGVAQHTRTQARISLSAIEALIASLKAIDGPKTLVLLSEGIVIDPRLVDIAELASAAKDARVTIYGLHMDTPLFEAAQDRISPTFLRDVQLRGDGLERLAGAARGRAFRLVGSDARPFQRIAQEISGYYLLAFESVDADRDGRVHRIKVSLARGGGELRARQAFRVPPGIPSARAREEQLVALLRDSRPFTELPVRVATYTYVEPRSTALRVVVSTEADAAGDLSRRSSLSSTRAEADAAEVLVGYVLVDSRGIVAASGAQRAGAGRHAFSTVLSPGAYTLRVAGIDLLGRHGMVERPFVAAVETRGDVRWSDLILAPVPPSDESPLHPIVNRVTGPRLTAYLELYAMEAGPLREVQVTFEIASAAGSEAQVTVEADVVRRDARWAIARAVLPLESLAPGRYVARARVVRGGQELGRATRPFSVVRARN